MNNKITINWRVRQFDQLNTAELYEILKLRAEVFVVEQNCPYQDLDGLDDRCFHLLGWTNDGILAAYARILPIGVDAYASENASSKEHGSLGRIVVAPSYRGIGHQLLDKAIDVFHDQIGDDIPCVIHAQAHLKQFYEQHGFVQTGEMELIDGIEHVEMTL